MIQIRLVQVHPHSHMHDGGDLRCHDIDHSMQVYWCSYMLILNIRSRPQLQAIMAKMEKAAEEEFGRTLPSTAENSRHPIPSFKIELEITMTWHGDMQKSSCHEPGR